MRWGEVKRIQSGVIRAAPCSLRNPKHGQKSKPGKGTWEVRGWDLALGMDHDTILLVGMSPLNDVDSLPLALDSPCAAFFASASTHSFTGIPLCPRVHQSLVLRPLCLHFTAIIRSCTM